MVLFGLPLTGTRTTETNLYTLYLRSVPRGFFKVWEAPYDKRGEQLCTTQVKGTTLDTDEGKRHPRCFAKGPENNKREKKGAPQWDVLGIFSSTRSAHDYRIKLHKNTHSRGNKNKKKTTKKKKKSHQSLSCEAWQVREHDDAIFLFMLGVCIKYVLCTNAGLSKPSMPVMIKAPQLYRSSG